MSRVLACIQLVNLMYVHGQLKDLVCVVVDELHMISDGFRGFLLEILLTKLQCHRRRPGHQTQLQLVAMSATIPNLSTLARWLDAELFTTNFRPVKLETHVAVGREVLSLPEFEVNRFLSSNLMSDNLITLCAEATSVLAFCPTKRGCQTTAQLLVLHAQSFCDSAASAVSPSCCDLSGREVTGELAGEL
jgi:DNA polymerase theta